MQAMNSPASLAKGIKEVRSPGRTKERKGAGGGLGIKPHYNLAYDESNQSLAFYPLTPLRSRQIGITLPAECTISPPYLDVHWTSLHPSFHERQGSWAVHLDSTPR